MDDFDGWWFRSNLFYDHVIVYISRATITGDETKKQNIGDGGLRETTFFLLEISEVSFLVQRSRHDEITIC